MCAYYSESQIASPEGLSLFIRKWKSSSGPSKAHLLVLHGYMEHGGRYRDLAHVMAECGIAVSAVDLRGHGRSEGRRGHVQRFDNYLDDAQTALDTLGDAPRFILGHSNGGLVALDLAVSRRPKINGLVVTNPFLALTTKPNPVSLGVGRLLGRYGPTLSLPSGLPPSGLSHDAEIVDAYCRDPLVFSTVNAGWFKELAAAQERAMGFRRVEVPLLYIYSDADPIASPAANRTLSDQLHSQDKSVVLREGEYHEVLNERDREVLHRQIAEWILTRAAPAGRRSRRAHAASGTI